MLLLLLLCFLDKDGILEGARYLISEAYTRIHQRVSIEDLSKRLNLSREEGEKWIVNLVRDTRVGGSTNASQQDAKAKIDFKAGIVEMSNALSQTTPPIYQSVIEQTRGFTFRTAAMGQAIDRKAHPVQSQDSQQLGGGVQRGGGAGGRGGRGGGGGRGGAARGGARGGAAAAGAGSRPNGQESTAATQSSTTTTTTTSSATPATTPAANTTTTNTQVSQEA